MHLRNHLHAFGSAVILLLMAAVVGAPTACADRRSELTVAYRGGAAAERAMVRVRVDTGNASRVITPSFPSAARPVAVRTRGELPIEVALLGARGDTVARHAPSPIRLAPRTTYALGVIVGRRPPASRCIGEWTGSPIAGRADSVFVSVTATPRAKEPPRCDE